MSNVSILAKSTISTINTFLGKHKLPKFDAKQLKAMNGIDPLGLKYLSGIYIRGDILNNDLEDLDKTYDGDIDVNCVYVVVLNTCHQQTDLLMLDSKYLPLGILPEVTLN
jgi:hypothetical protein